MINKEDRRSVYIMASYYIGIDLGTSSLKGLLVDADGSIVKSESRDYPVYYPHPGWSEQDPADWVKAMREVLSVLGSGVENDVKGISFGGQMHGLVVLDADDNVIRPCILWNDGRTESQTAYLNETVGRQCLSKLTGNIAFAGFTAPKLLWLKENEPDNFARISKIMLPKDYLAYTLTGVFSTDYSDASGTLLLDVENKVWSTEMCEICGVRPEWLPDLYESYEITGYVKPGFGLTDAAVTAGAGDNAAAAVGTGTVFNGSCNISLGTSGTVFISRDGFSVDPNNALHSFAHANGKWHLMGCILSAASCRKWWIEDILGSDDYSADESLAAGSESGDVIFLPYLMGERSPHNDTRIRGAFIGLSADTSRAQMSRAVMEGVAFALCDCLRVASECGADIRESTICGGGARSEIWCQIIADVLDIPVSIPVTEQGPGYGAALLAMIGTGALGGFDDIIPLTQKNKTFYPDKNSCYAEKYEKFRKLYPAIRCAMEK